MLNTSMRDSAGEVSGQSWSAKTEHMYAWDKQGLVWSTHSVQQRVSLYLSVMSGVRCNECSKALHTGRRREDACNDGKGVGQWNA